MVQTKAYFVIVVTEIVNWL